MYGINQFSAQCIYTASENNREAVILLSASDHKSVLESFVQKTGDNTHFILLRTLLTGLSNL